MEKVKTLDEVAQDTLHFMTLDSDFETSDILSLSNAIEQIKKIDELELKPYLVSKIMNVYEPIHNYVDNALEVLGYEYIGNMDLNDGKYKFDSQELFYECLYRFKDKNCDYTKHMQVIDGFEELKK